MTVSILQERETSNGSASASSIVLAFSNAVVVGSSFHSFASGIDTATSFTCSDSVNGSHGTALDTIQEVTDTQRLAHFKFDNTASGTPTVTITPSTSVGFLAVWIREIGGTSGYDAAHKAAIQSAVASGTDVVTTGTQAPNNQPGLLSALAVCTSNFVLPTAGTGFTAGANGWDFGTSNTACTESKRYTALTAIAATFSNSGGSNDFGSLAAFFKESTSAVTPLVPVDTAEPLRRVVLQDFAPANLLTQQTLKLPPFTQKELPGYALRAKGVYTDFAPFNLLAQQTLKSPPFTQENDGARTFTKGVYTDFTTPNLLSLTLTTPSAPLLALDLSQQVKARWAGSDFSPANLLIGILPAPPTAPQDATIAIRAKGVFTDFSPPNLALSTLIPLAPATPQDISGIRLEYRWVRGDSFPNLSLSTLAVAAAAPLLPQDISGIRLDARGLRSDFVPPNLTLTLPVPPPPPPSTAAGRHGTRRQARRRRQLDVLRAKLEAFKEQRIEADQALMRAEEGEIKTRANLLKRVKVKPLTKPLEEYAPVKKAVAQRTVVMERHRSILEQILMHQLEAERIQREIEDERDEEAALHLFHFLMMETSWHE